MNSCPKQKQEGPWERLIKALENSELKAVDGCERQASWHAVGKLVPPSSRQ